MESIISEQSLEYVYKYRVSLDIIIANILTFFEDIILIDVNILIHHHGPLAKGILTIQNNHCHQRLQLIIAFIDFVSLLKTVLF